MEWLLVVAVVGFVFWQIAKGFNENYNKPKLAVSVTHTDDSEEDARREAEIKQIRSEIEAEVAKHADAVRFLQALSRIDGQTSEAERRVIFSFLQRNGAALTEERHWPYFAHRSGGEVYRAVATDEIGAFVAALADKEMRYRIDVYSAAQAIVATGGAPKKREADALAMAEALITA